MLSSYSANEPTPLRAEHLTKWRTLFPLRGIQESQVTLMNNSFDESSSYEARAESRLLLVEDSHVLQAVLRLMCHRNGYSYDIVGSSNEAEEAFNQREYAMVFMDWNLPDKSGLECAKNLREMESPRHTPVIAMTGSVSADDRDRCKEATMDDFMGKPYSIQDFSNMVEKWRDASL